MKFEPMHSDPQIAIIHDLISAREAKDVIDIVKGNLKTTPYTFLGKSREYSPLRSSKIMYVSETHTVKAMKLSKVIEMATGFTLTQDKYASENYQIMNYGIGGKIVPHIDSSKYRAHFQFSVSITVRD